MKTSGLSNFIPKVPIQQDPKKRLNKADFNDIMGNFVKDVNASQMDSKKIVSDFVEGKDVELHDVMIAGEKAKTSLELLMQIRNKTVDMYRELTRMS